MNCWPWDCSITANWHKLLEWEEWIVWACPPKYLGNKLVIDMWFGKQDFYCYDVWWAIQWRRLDIRSGFWQTGYDNIKNWTIRNTGKAKVYIF